MRRGSHSQGDEEPVLRTGGLWTMSGGDASSIKQMPSCAADLPILSPKCGKAAGCVYSNYLCAVLWGAERFSIETTLSIEFRRKIAPCRHIFSSLV